MMDQLRNYVQTFIDITDVEFQKVAPFFSPLRLMRGEILVEAGACANQIAFIRSGIMRSFYNVGNDEITQFVLMKNNFVTALTSFISKTPSRENIQAITDCELYVINRTDLDQLYDKFPFMQKLGRLVMEHSHINLERRLFAFISQSAEERYKLLTMEQPEILQKVPLQYIASILGIKPETLSRIRKKILL